MRVSPVLAIVSLAFCSQLGVPASAQTPIPDNILSAITDEARPPLHRFRDDRRKPAETMAFAGIGEGMTVLELIPGNGYYTRLLSRAVGPEGKIYTVPGGEPRAATSAELSRDPAYGNIEMLSSSVVALAAPEPVDLVWTSQNYHDVRAFSAAINRAVFAALKPNGVYFILDHSAEIGAREETIALHRIDEDLVKAEVQSAGFILEDEGDFLRNPSDSRTLQIMERDLNRQTDQFVLRFRKPAE